MDECIQLSLLVAHDAVGYAALIGVHTHHLLDLVPFGIGGVHIIVYRHIPVEIGLQHVKVGSLALSPG